MIEEPVDIERDGREVLKKRGELVIEKPADTAGEDCQADYRKQDGSNFRNSDLPEEPEQRKEKNADKKREQKGYDDILPCREDESYGKEAEQLDGALDCDRYIIHREAVAIKIDFIPVI